MSISIILPSHIFIVLISVLVCFVFLLCFYRDYIYICLQLLGLPQTPTGALSLDPARGLPSPDPSLSPLANSWLLPQSDNVELSCHNWPQHMHCFYHLMTVNVTSV